MPRRATRGTGLLVTLLIAACGGSGHSSSSSSTASTTSDQTAPAATSAASSTTTSSTTTSPNGTSTVSAGPTSSTTATTSAQPPEVPKGKRSQRSHRVAPASGVHIAAAFIIGPGGNVTPPLVSAPPGVTIELQLKDADGKPHVVVLDTATKPAVHLAARGHATEEVTGLRNGTYTILVDGVTRARLVVGAVPGP